MYTTLYAMSYAIATFAIYPIDSSYKNMLSCKWLLQFKIVIKTSLVAKHLFFHSGYFVSILKMDISM
jgi:hypothetical protein